MLYLSAYSFLVVGGRLSKSLLQEENIKMPLCQGKFRGKDLNI